MINISIAQGINVNIIITNSLSKTEIINHIFTGRLLLGFTYDNDINYKLREHIIITLTKLLLNSDYFTYSGVMKQDKLKQLDVDFSYDTLDNKHETISLTITSDNIKDLLFDFINQLNNKIINKILI